MSKLIKFFGIMKQTGISLLELKFDDRYDENLMGGFLSAVFGFGDESCSEDMSKVSLEGDNMRISSINHHYNKDISLMAVGVLSKAIREREFKEFAEKVLNKFCEKYEKELTHFRGETSLFDPFKDYLKEEIEKNYSNGTIEFEDKLDDIFKKFSEGDMSGLDELDDTFKKFIDDG